uniref:Uncharacterized protein n=1 Tax=Leersia perrieri TaxID=77586 RepID=A0A0D9VRI0_9ORYZ
MAGRRNKDVVFVSLGGDRTGVILISPGFSPPYCAPVSPVGWFSLRSHCNNNDSTFCESKRGATAQDPSQLNVVHLDVRYGLSSSSMLLKQLRKEGGSIPPRFF